MKIGIDFGTTNSAVAVVEHGVPRMLELYPGEKVQRTVIHASPEGDVSFGNPAFRAYVEGDLMGRFLRSLKAFLPSDVTTTTFAGRRMSFTDLVTTYLRFLVERTESTTGRSITSVVVGRPVRFSHDAEREALATGRLERAVRDAGLPDPVFQLEPVAAAHAYERSLSGERIVLVGDFGGGTADFAVLRVGPDRIGRDRFEDVLATSGVAAAGDALDGRFMDTFLMPWFGRGARVRPRSESGADEWIDWDHPLQRQILRLYYIHLLRDDALERRLLGVRDRVSDPAVVDRMHRLVFDDLGYPMAWAIEAAKRALSEESVTRFRFDEFYSERLDIETEVDLPTYEQGSATLLDRYASAVDEALAGAGLGQDAIDEVFLTGGTSQLPFVQRRFAERFGADRLRSGDAFTSVCEGLALSG
ncbi:MAG: Hsp70 family protein [Myxococcota bacterium]